MKLSIGSDLIVPWHRNGESKRLDGRKLLLCRVFPFVTNLFFPFPTAMTYRCVHYGVLTDDEATRVNKMVVARKGNKGAAPTPASKTKAKKVKVEADVAVEADLQMPGAERVGSSTML